MISVLGEGVKNLGLWQQVDHCSSVSSSGNQSPCAPPLSDGFPLEIRKCFQAREGFVKVAAGLVSRGEADVGGVVEVAECLDIPDRKVEAVAALVAGSEVEGVIAAGTVALTGPPSSSSLGCGGGPSRLFQREHESLTAALASESDVRILPPGRSSCGPPLPSMAIRHSQP